MTTTAVSSAGLMLAMPDTGAHTTGFALCNLLLPHYPIHISAEMSLAPKPAPI